MTRIGEIPGRLACLLGFHEFPPTPVDDHPPAFWWIDCARQGCSAFTIRLGLHDIADTTRYQRVQRAWT